jgi:hypothetical protein
LSTFVLRVLLTHVAGESLDYHFDGHGYFTLVEESDDDEPDV